MESRAIVRASASRARAAGKSGRSVAGPFRPGDQRGFTLLEIIVVVLLIAISATFVVVNLERDTDTLARLESERFARLIEQARDESIISGRPYAVSVNPDQNYYEFLRYRAGDDKDKGEAETGDDEDSDDGEWVPVTDDQDRTFRRREVPVDLNVIFELLAGSGKSGLMVIEGLGDITPFNFMIEGDSRVYAVRLDDNQNVAVSDVTPE